MCAHKLQNDFLRQRKTARRWLLGEVEEHALGLQLLHQGLLPSQVPTIKHGRTLPIFVREVEEPLDALHVELEFTVAELVQRWNREWQV